ncbi:MAG: class I SAM-dependent methyltransferase [Candidatus Marinimicrobia bacterium]|nr:class I SAM-dependent methyltransferase [Candidatus Neomarinimicrobiota bacterium]
MNGQPGKFNAFIYDPLLRTALRPLRQRVLSKLPPDKYIRVLDMCCGTGDQLHYLSEQGYRALQGVDLSGDMLSAAKRKLPHVKFALADAAHTAFSDAVFDIIIITLALHDKEQRAREDILREAGRLLRPGGRLIVADFLFDDKTRRRSRNIITLIEYVAGGDHYKNFRDYLQRGAFRGSCPENFLR